VTHTTASLKALESAFGIVPDDQTIKLRRLMCNGEIIQSHILHLYILAAPDFFGVKSIFPLIKTNEDIVKRAFRLKGLANDLCKVIGGRHTHPCSMVVNGFTNLPNKGDLSLILERFKDTYQDVEETVSLFRDIRFPDFNRKTEYLSLDGGPQYNFYDGTIRSSVGWTIAPKLYRDVIKEFVVNNSTAKFARSSIDSYMVGAMARTNNNFDKLNKRAKEVASELGFTSPSFNPFMNNIAQVIEIVQCIDDTIELLEDVLGEDLKAKIPLDRDGRIKGGVGVGAVEAPRGTLYHEYEIDEKGIITGANCIIPTAQNLNNIQLDLQAFVTR
jgi:coenzyme F420-reducing hydrogenase alpha subunit